MSLHPALSRDKSLLSRYRPYIAMLTRFISVTRSLILKASSSDGRKSSLLKSWLMYPVLISSLLLAHEAVRSFAAKAAFRAGIALFLIVSASEFVMDLLSHRVLFISRAVLNKTSITVYE
jgi:hypothetical protein